MNETTPPRTTALEKNINAIITLEQEALHSLTPSERASHVIAGTAGSVRFALIHVVVFATWFLVNTGMFRVAPIFDPFPFNLLTVLVSLEAIFLSIFLLINQNVMSRHADRRAHLDLQVNLLAEQESTRMLEMVRRLCRHSGVQVDDLLREVKDLTKETDVHQLVAELKKGLPAEKQGSDATAPGDESRHRRKG